MANEHPFPFVDVALAQRLERAEANANAAFVQSRARLHPQSGAAWCDVRGTYVMFDGVGSPLTQTFGFGLFAAPTDDTLAEIESFLLARGADVFHETSPLADAAVLQRLPARGYVPVEYTSVMFRPMALPAETNDAQVRARLIDRGEAESWARTAAEGWASESEELRDFMLELGTVSAGSDRTHCFLAELDGRPIATGALSISDDVALLAGASTIPAGRRQGAQRALLEARMRFAMQRGCTLAMMCAAPGSASQRNAERQGFRIAYTRVKWMLQRAR